MSLEDCFFLEGVTYRPVAQVCWDLECFFKRATVILRRRIELSIREEVGVGGERIGCQGLLGVIDSTNTWRSLRDQKGERISRDTKAEEYPVTNLHYIY
jgi:hypothetical protein